ncbi:MAG: hypothetical protein WCA90_04665, partial [Ilumatobacteraceae bacterium]
MSDFDEFDELDGLLGRLRQPATPAELASETKTVDLMATTHRHAKGTTMFSSRRTRVATIIAAGLIGFGGVAAASPTLVGPDDIDKYVEATEQQAAEDEAAAAAEAQAAAEAAEAAEAAAEA